MWHSHLTTTTTTTLFFFLFNAGKLLQNLSSWLHKWWVSTYRRTIILLLLTICFTTIFDIRFFTFLKKQLLLFFKFYFDPADQEKEREESQKKLNEALLEKEQVASDLNNMERSFADLFKRLEKYKEVVQGYKKVGTHEHVSPLIPLIHQFFHKSCNVLFCNLFSFFHPRMKRPWKPALRTIWPGSKRRSSATRPWKRTPRRRSLSKNSNILCTWFCFQFGSCK